jgi:hypothetical protein
MSLQMVKAELNMVTIISELHAIAYTQLERFSLIWSQSFSSFISSFFLLLEVAKTHDVTFRSLSTSESVSGEVSMSLKNETMKNKLEHFHVVVDFQHPRLICDSRKTRTPFSSLNMTMQDWM